MVHNLPFLMVQQPPPNSTGVNLSCMPQPRHFAGGVAVICVLALASTACGGRAAVRSQNSWRSATSSDSPSTSAHRPAAGILRGQVVRPPGRDPRSGAQDADPDSACSAKGGWYVPVNGDEVEVRDMLGQVIASAVTRSGGLFSIALPPGEYRIVEGICGVSKHVNIRSGLPTHVILTIPNAC
jgi:hypothetical protein